MIQSAYADDHVNFQNMYETGSSQIVIQCFTFSEPCIVMHIHEKDEPLLNYLFHVNYPRHVSNK